MTGHVWIFVIFFLGLVWMQGLVAASGTSRLPRPFLTQNSEANVVKVGCQPPPKVYYSVHDIRMFGPSGKKSSNETLVIWTSATDRPYLTEHLSPLATVSFSGSFKNKNPSLSMLMPFSGKFNVRFNCTMEVTQTGVRTSIVSSSINVRVIPAHEIVVTWRTQGALDFTEARVGRILVDKNGVEITAPQTLFVTNGRQNLTFEDAGFLLAYLDTMASGTNYTLTAFARKGRCKPDCIYTCDIPHTYCFGSDAKYCNCRWKELDTAEAYKSHDTSIAKDSQDDSLDNSTDKPSSNMGPKNDCLCDENKYRIAVIVLSVIVGSVLIVVVVVRRAYICSTMTKMNEHCTGCLGTCRSNTEDNSVSSSTLLDKTSQTASGNQIQRHSSNLATQAGTVNNFYLGKLYMSDTVSKHKKDGSPEEKDINSETEMSEVRAGVVVQVRDTTNDGDQGNFPLPQSRPDTAQALEDEDHDERDNVEPQE